MYCTLQRSRGDDIRNGTPSPPPGSTVTSHNLNPQSFSSRVSNPRTVA